MMEIVFAVLVLTLIYLGLRKRKKEKGEWVREERYEESGDWIDKRSGERGTYGSLDEEMESERLYIARQGKIQALTTLIQSFCFAQYPDFHRLSDAQLKRHVNYTRSEIKGFSEQIENLLNGRLFSIKEAVLPEDKLRAALKKLILDFSFENFPKLLELDLEQIKKFDRGAEHVAGNILGAIE